MNTFTCLGLARQLFPRIDEWSLITTRFGYSSWTGIRRMKHIQLDPDAGVHGERTSSLTSLS